ncbi:MAG: hypothetical protein ACO3JL_12150, partial [Myxococcota bacterium]
MGNNITRSPTSVRTPTQAPVRETVRPEATARPTPAVGETVPAAPAEAPVARPSVAPEEQKAPSKLEGDISAHGLKTNQDLINHAYRQASGGLSNSDGNYAAARDYLQKNYGVSMGDLIASRGAAIQVPSAPAAAAPAAAAPTAAAPAAAAPAAAAP